MKTFTNQHRFIKAAEYANAHFFSKPYSITPIVDRWFNQLAMIEFANGSIVHLSADVAKKYVDIKRADGTAVDKADIELIFKYYSKHSEYEKEDERLAGVISKSERQLAELGMLPESKEKNKKIKVREKVVLETQNKIKAIEEEKDKAEALYEDLASPDEDGNPRGQWVLQVERIEKAYKSTIKNIVYRPNHGITHSVRAAYSVPELVAYNQKYARQPNLLTDIDIEKLQLMMLFSVVGRRDETGFNDTGRNDASGNGADTYAGFRETSGREYLKYCQHHAADLYPNDLEGIYRDAIVVELMGYSSIDDAMARGNIPGVFIDYVIQKEHLYGRDMTEYDALLLIQKQQYQLSNLYPSGTEIRTRADALLGLMNDAHGLDLSRCYPLFPNRKGGPAIIGNMQFYLSKAGFFDFSSEPDPEKLTAFFQLMRCSFDALALTGQNTTFGMISADEFAVKKDAILSEVSRISERFRTTDPDARSALLQAAKKANASEDMADYFTCSKQANDEYLLASYRNHLIVHTIAVQLSQAAKLNPSVKMFDLNAVADGLPLAVDHHQTAVNLVNALQTVTPFPGIIRTALPIVCSVHHDRTLNRATLFFDERAQAEQFLKAYAVTFESQPTLKITLNDKNQFVVDVNRTHYKQLVRDKQLEFKPVTIPAVVSREEGLVDENGNIDALNLIEQSRGLVRLVSTTPLGGETHPDYDYFFRALDDPLHERYTTAFSDKGTWRADRTHYQDPTNGASYTRKISATPELQFQEPITTPGVFEDKKDGHWTVGEKRSEPKNTIYTKKQAYSLLPPHGKVVPFPGYLAKAHQYFPIGVLSDLKTADLKSGRYAWSQNMVTHTKFWVRDTSSMDQSMRALFEDAGVKPASPPQAIIKYAKNLEARAEAMIKRLDNKYYRPSDDLLNEIKAFIAKERSQISARELNAIYDRMLHRVEEEGQRKGAKYAITLDELIAEQKQTTEAGAHNEILAANTKGAVRALYASKDELFDRLNLVLHAMNIKDKYHYDVPLLVMSVDKPPYCYTEDMIKADLLEAYRHLQAGTFPYDETMLPVYDLDKNGDVKVDENNQPKIKKENKREVYRPKDKAAQMSALFNLFSVGMPQLKHMDELVRGTMDGVAIDSSELDRAVSSIVETLDVVGNVRRETHLMEAIFSSHDLAKQEAFFLRAAALGHLELIKTMIARDDFNVTEPLFEKAAEFAQNHHHVELEAVLRSEDRKILNDIKMAQHAIALLKIDLLTLPTDMVGPESIVKKMQLYLEIITQYESLSRLTDVSTSLADIRAEMGQFICPLFGENHLDNQHVEEFLHFLAGHPDFIEPYARVMASRIGLKGENIDIRVQKKACEDLIAAIEQAACGPNDTEIIDYCNAMKKGLDMAGNDLLYLANTEQKLRDIHTAVTSPEMKAVNAEIVRLKTSTWFGGQAKIDRIQDAVCNVPLSQRFHVLTGDNSECNQVRIELATHRKSFTNPLDKKNEVIELKAANSYKNALRALRAEGHAIDSPNELPILAKK